MTALGLVNTLRTKTRTIDAAAIKDDDYGWGTYKVPRAFEGRSQHYPREAVYMHVHIHGGRCNVGKGWIEAPSR